jgi:hypothetical protein
MISIMLKSSVRFGFYAATLTTLAFVSNMAPVEAASVIQDSNSNVTGINGLDVLGTNYDVAFFRGEYNTVFEEIGLGATFLGNEVGAQAAIDAIVAAINALSPIPSGIFDVGAPVFGAQPFVFVPFKKDPTIVPFLGGLVTFKSGRYRPNTQTWQTSGNSVQGGAVGVSQLAVFTAKPVPTPVPTPAMLPSIIGFGVTVLRRKQLESKAV